VLFAAFAMISSSIDLTELRSCMVWQTWRGNIPDATFTFRLNCFVLLSHTMLTYSIYFM